jgi:hypothetical protein
MKLLKLIYVIQLNIMKQPLAVRKKMVAKLLLNSFKMLCEISMQQDRLIMDKDRF